MKFWYTESQQCQECPQRFVVRLPLAMMFWNARLFHRALDIHSFEISVHEYAHKMEKMYAK